MLHDIGKVLFRYNDGRNHALSGADFLAKQAGVVDKDILEQVKYHHAALLKNSGVAEKSLAYISYIADNIAAFLICSMAMLNISIINVPCWTLTIFNTQQMLKFVTMKVFMDVV